MQHKQVSWEVILSELGFTCAGSGAHVHKLRQEFEGSALDQFVFNAVLRLNGALIV